MKRDIKIKNKQWNVYSHWTYDRNYGPKPAPLTSVEAPNIDLAIKAYVHQKSKEDKMKLNYIEIGQYTNNFSPNIVYYFQIYVGDTEYGWIDIVEA